MKEQDVIKAEKLAEIAHKGQKRITGEEYIVHPKRVKELVEKNWANHPKIKELLIVAYLHDVIEDTKLTHEDLKNKFNEEIANLVFELTEDKSLDLKERHEEHIKKLSLVSNEAKIVKVCDILDNITDKPWKKLLEKTADILQVLDIDDELHKNKQEKLIQKGKLIIKEKLAQL